MISYTGEELFEVPWNAGKASAIEAAAEVMPIPDTRMTRPVMVKNLISFFIYTPPSVQQSAYKINDTAE